MRWTPLAVVLLATTTAHAADDPPKATGTLDGKKVQFPEMGIADGVKATLALLGSCSSEDKYDADEQKKAEQGDYIRLVFAKPVTVKVMKDTLGVSEIVIRQPLEMQSQGVFWVRSDNRVRRYAKFDGKIEPFATWLQAVQPVDR